MRAREEADDIAPHWKGGRYSLIENKAQERVILRYVSEWDSPESAQDFFHFYPQRSAQEVEEDRDRQSRTKTPFPEPAMTDTSW